MTYNDLLIEILNMTPEERKKYVRYTDNVNCPDDSTISIGTVYRFYGEIYLVEE